MTRLLILWIICILNACNHQNLNFESSKGDTDITRLKIIKTTQDSSKEGFTIFWQLFRKAVINTDTTQLLNLISFPLQTRGTFDDDSIINISPQKFNKVFFTFLNQTSGKDLIGSTELDDIKKNEYPIVSILSGHVRIGDMVFLYKNKEWKLHLLYLNNETNELLER